MEKFKPNTKASREELERRRLHLIEVFEDLEKYFQRIMPSDSVEDQKKTANDCNTEDKK